METIINFAKRFVWDLYHALIFAAQEYDIKLQSEKTPLERIIIWFFIACMSLVVFFTLIWGLWKFLDSIEIKGI